ncbi:hypothetical protein CLOBOL_05036 [Enterocloster bolteae ATCC BAA-613]|uniref:Uncharacterized protein n=1 Tax=Enterocloster bolteae (strain ATCC BAA-613 / DSM 15670 / CCUG 46953 / JCM 12243 / WAL 16351) TaxID=411902 RepID=A8RY58_ENTBW|nr:hypothetical protein CLOBOL_05036 [Enterocloster bolteae ATCC BAA-613]
MRDAIVCVPRFCVRPFMFHGFLRVRDLAGAAGDIIHLHFR